MEPDVLFLGSRNKTLTQSALSSGTEVTEKRRME
jgi:hypothetical protein